MLCDEGVGKFSQESVISWGRRSRLRIFELAYDLLAQLQLYVIDQLVVLAESVQQFLLVQILFVHYRIFILTPHPTSKHFFVALTAAIILLV